MISAVFYSLDDFFSFFSLYDFCTIFSPQWRNLYFKFFHNNIFRWLARWLPPCRYSLTFRNQELEQNFPPPTCTTTNWTVFICRKLYSWNLVRRFMVLIVALATNHFYWLMWFLLSFLIVWWPALPRIGGSLQVAVQQIYWLFVHMILR